MKDTILKLRINSDVKSDLKVLCEKRQTSMSAWLTKKIQEEVRKDKDNDSRK